MRSLSRLGFVLRRAGGGRCFGSISLSQFDDRVSVSEIESGIVHVELNRPEKMNALDLKSFQAIAHTASTLKNDKSIRAVILSGKGRAFCTGLDVKGITNVMNMNKLLEKPAGTPISNLLQDVSYLWRQLPVPVICVLHGICYGGGLQIALGADFRYSTPDCKMSIMEAKWGIIPDMGISVTLRELCRIDIAKELTFTGKIFSAEEGCSYGLVTKAVEDPMEKALELARQIKSRSPDAVSAAKKLYQESWIQPDSVGLDLETELQKKILISWNQIATTGQAFGLSLPFSDRKDELTPGILEVEKEDLEGKETTSLGEKS